MNETQLQKFKATLQQLSRREREDIGHLVDAICEVDPPGEHDGGSPEPMDSDYALEQNEERIFQQVSDALRRIDAGTFGTCLDCEQKIALERLKAIPYAAYCIKCEEKHETG